jgi:hypothetical protein
VVTDTSTTASESNGKRYPAPRCRLVAFRHIVLTLLFFLP